MSQVARAEAEYLRIGGLDVRILHDLNTRQGPRRTRVVLLAGEQSVAHIPSDDPHSRETLAHMWRVLEHVRHPAFPVMYQALYDEQGFCGFVREFLPHHDPYWRQLFPGLTLETFLRLGTYLAFGAHRFHQLGYVLGDINPYNVCFKMWSWGLRPCYMDFDIITRIGEICGKKEEGEALLIMGTPGFISPEQVSGSPVTARTDQFSLAITLLAIATATPGFIVPRADLRTTMLRALQGTAQYPYWRIAQELLPDPLCSLFDTALQPTPDKRFANCLSFGHALKAGLRTLPEEVLQTPLPAEPLSDHVLQRRAMTFLGESS